MATAAEELFKALERRQDEARKYRRAAIQTEGLGHADAAATHALMSIACSLEALVAIGFELLSAKVER